MKKHVIFSLCFLMLPLSVLAHREDDGKVTKKHTKRSKDGSVTRSSETTTSRDGKKKMHKKNEEVYEQDYDEDRDGDHRSHRNDGDKNRGRVTGRKKLRNDDRTMITGRKKHHIVRNMFGGGSDSDSDSE
jgi:hypothetical protein